MAGRGNVRFAPDGAFDDPPDVAIVVFAKTPTPREKATSRTCRTRRHTPSPLATLRSLKARGVPVVSVFVTGRPLWVNPELNASDAFVVAWLPGSEGGGVADVLFRDAAGRMIDFRGKLAFSWPRDPWQTSVNRGDEPYEPLFPYGFGLRYADGATASRRLCETPVAPSCRRAFATTFARVRFMMRLAAIAAIALAATHAAGQPIEVRVAGQDGVYLLLRVESPMW